MDKPPPQVSGPQSPDVSPNSVTSASYNGHVKKVVISMYDKVVKLVILLLEPSMASCIADSEVNKCFNDMNFHTGKAIGLNAKCIQRASDRQKEDLFQMVYTIGMKNLRNVRSTMIDSQFNQLLRAFEAIMDIEPRNWEDKWRDFPTFGLKPWGVAYPPFHPNFKPYTCLTCICPPTTEIPGLHQHGFGCRWIGAHLSDDRCQPCHELRDRLIMCKL